MEWRRLGAHSKLICLLTLSLRFPFMTNVCIVVGAYLPTD